MEEMYTATIENNKMLKSMRRSAFIGGIVKAVWWILIIIILPYLTWLYIQPYLNNIMDQYQTVQEQGGAISAQASGLQEQLSGFQDLLKQFGIGSTK